MFEAEVASDICYVFNKPEQLFNVLSKSVCLLDRLDEIRADIQYFFFFFEIDC